MYSGGEPVFEQFVYDEIQKPLLRMEHGLLPILLFDRSTRKNLIWAADDYASLGAAYTAESEILPESITGEHAAFVRPRTAKDTEAQQNRVREKAVVFTLSCGFVISRIT